ncbi:DUF1127 domain-containing protein [Marinomonas flavescens]|uniref:DUF1127 domain-containing protein n=1 Tax=Marinomonas flavescens TaxID=2529379 RepID=UPI0010567A36|nr:DUF1127 domain-containing protein [Marinomonas flavescens]
MLIISLLTHIQHCIERYQTRKALDKLSEQQMQDIGLSHEKRQAELSQASFIGVVSDLLRTNSKGDLS